jgi:BNR repeat-like domain
VAFVGGLSLVLAGTTGTAIADDKTAGPLVQVSGESPLLDCTADGIADQSGEVFLNSEVEPWIDVNPTNTSNVAGIWQQDRWSNGGARGLVAGISMNGGASWQEVVIPGITLCSGGIYDRSTDPWVTFGPDGTLHQLALSFNDIAAPFEPRDFDHALLASRSTDGGLTWSTPIEVIRDLDANVFNDKQTITADPTDADLVYAVWDRLVFPTSERASVISGFVTAAFRGPAWFARSTDGGVTWEAAKQIYDPGQNDQTIGNQIVVLPDGTLVDVFNEIRNDNRGGHKGNNVALLRSTDQGVSWSERIFVDRLGTIFITDPETGDPVRTGDIIPEVAVDPASGALYVVWQDARFSDGEFDSIAFSQSLDGGLTWSEPIKVNLTPTNVPPGNQQAFTPSVHVAADGTVGVTYYDFRNNTAAEPLLTDYFLVHCHPEDPGGCADSDNWGDEVRVTNSSFDMRLAPFALGFFTGDYEGLSSIGDSFTPFFSQSHGTDPSSTFFRAVG